MVWKSVASGVLQGLVQEPLLLHDLYENVGHLSLLRTQKVLKSRW